MKCGNSAKIFVPIPFLKLGSKHNRFRIHSRRHSLKLKSNTNEKFNEFTSFHRRVALFSLSRLVDETALI